MIKRRRLGKRPLLAPPGNSVPDGTRPCQMGAIRVNLSSEGRPTEVHAGDRVLAPLKGRTRRWVISLHSGQGSTHAEFGAARVNSRSGVVQHGGPIRPCAANGTEESAEERH